MSRYYRASDLEPTLVDRLQQLEDRLEDLEQTVECLRAELTEAKKESKEQS